ncbi:MAG TPA: twin-arginine translocase TatA/TatE family subunit [Fimbriimonadaceae bacterium]|nr:twin-arginine translocase TatA/TatE family subunit [Fimbriimonadaceae bacterium]
MTLIYNLTQNLGNILQPWHIIILVVVIVLFFGGSKIPELMKGVGQGMGEFKKGVEEGKSNKDDDENKS